MIDYIEVSDAFQPDEPIFVDDISAMFPDKSRPWVDKVLRSMVEANVIRRYDQGIYYKPRKTAFGESLINPMTVLTRRYIKDNDNVFGFLSGMSLLNEIGLTTQVPNVITIMSNKEKSRGRNVIIGGQSAYLIKTPCKVNNENYKVLKLLEAIRLVDFDSIDVTERENLKTFINENDISLSDVSNYCNYYPDYVSKRILGGGIVGMLT